MTHKKKKVLQVLIGGEAFTGVSSYLYQYYKNMDTERVKFDFLFCKENSLAIHKDEPLFLDSRFFVLNAKTKGNSIDYKKFIAGIENVLRENTYDAIVINTSVVMVEAACIFAARKQKNTTIIAHAHNTDILVKSKTVRAKLKSIFRILDGICRNYVVRHADFLFGCSKEAGLVTFGEKALESEKFKVINNAIDTDKFIYSETTRDSVRKEYLITDDQLIFGNVGKLSYRKNQVFLIDVFNEIHKRNPRSVLWIIGEGPEEDNLKKQIDMLKLKESVVFLGQKDNVGAYMQAMDCFVFTTKSEGLGIVAIEAQAAGLPTIVSDGVPREAIITDMAEQISLSSGVEVWADTALKVVAKKRCNMAQRIIDSGYDIHTEAMKFTEFFEKLKK